MKRYMFKRFLRSLFSIFMVLTIVFTLIYSVIPRDRVFFSDTNIEKIQKRPDDYANYKYVQWEKLGYLNYDTIQDYCKQLYGSANEQYSNCILPESSETADYVALKEKEGWDVDFFEVSKQAYAVEEVPILRRALNWWANLIEIDYPGKVQTENTELERKVYVGQDFNGRPALMCTGCENKYLVYFDGNFPFIHQNWISINLGTSYPTYSGQGVLEVVTSSQGEKVKKEVIDMFLADSS